ncbi:MAG: DEAD/DEAH box helicase [bacterium]
MLKNVSTMTEPAEYPTLALNPQGHLLWTARDGEMWPVESAVGRVAAAFFAGVTAGLLHLASREADTQLPAVPSFWRKFTRLYLTQFCHRTDILGLTTPTRLPPEVELSDLVDHAPPMVGGEYLSVDIVKALWGVLDAETRLQAGRCEGGSELFLKGLSPVWRMVGRVCFHLAENPKNHEFPFAFLATYSMGVSSSGQIQHRPLGQALRENVGEDQRIGLLKLLSPVHRCAGKSSWLKNLVESGAIFKPLAWKPEQAFQFLKEIPVFEENGVVVRMPDRWGGKRPSRPMVSVRVGDTRKAGLGMDALLDFNVGVTLGDDALTPEDWKTLMEASSGLVLIRGRWVEADPEKLRETLDQWKKAEAAAGQGVSFGEALRMLAGLEIEAETGMGEVTPETRPWLGLQAGAWLEETLAALRDPARLGGSKIPHGLDDVLRPYQQTGVEWLRFMNTLGLGACLADDMGLGKTIQVLGLLAARKHEGGAKAGKTSILVAPASLMANWQAEIKRFAPSLKARILHPSDMPSEDWRHIQKDVASAVKGCDLAVTTYGMVARWEALRRQEWDLVILDEAQAIKNPAARQTKAVKELRAVHRIALTGTPIENRLGDLWSLFDYLNPGLLGSAKRFNDFIKESAGNSEGLGSLRNLVRPYILRRLKTDKRVIADLPDKTEIKAYCSLSRKQAALYEQSVNEMRTKLEEVDGIARRGLVLGYIMRFKQICNHPSHWLRDQTYSHDESGKFIRLRELAMEIASRQEKALVFTQFQEMTQPLASCLAEVFRRPGLILHGAIPVKDRRRLVETFQAEDGPPFFVLTTKAGGTGLNLTAASHVIHFDRWWNPAVENQATDRAFRIGQKRNVLVHKFVCRGTFEEKIDVMLEEKAALARDVVDGEGGEVKLTEMSNAELMKFVSLDIERAGSLDY